MMRTIVRLMLWMLVYVITMAALYVAAHYWVYGTPPAWGAPAPLPRRSPGRPELPAQCVVSWGGFHYHTCFTPSGGYSAGHVAGQSRYVGSWHRVGQSQIVIRKSINGVDWMEYAVTLQPCWRKGIANGSVAWEIVLPQPPELAPPPREDD